ncbi:MAG: hypothetical protein V4687_07210 [Bacteroidota bacterium]
MKFVILLLLLRVSVPVYGEPELSAVRKLFYMAAVESSASVEFSKTLKSVNENSSALMFCYKGAAHMMEAKYAFNPITKFIKFSKGKSAIERSIAREQENLEMRFLRFSIQVNLPGFLGYNDQIQADKLKLLSKINDLDDKFLKEKITAYLIASKRCSQAELKKLQR